ncbi:MAG: UDP-2,4-diacetamido-2,4,6-trideoxy-beta-L-altropyranose hydrolase [Candidatus Hydrogenedentales bacterium]|jgi:UDP-2,4-diacetamido-2,4,6-trideoxy-beta-L-altropyranose hydrolase
MDEYPVVFLCDGSRDIGLGHVSRCVALAEALQEQGKRAHFHGCFEAGAQELLREAGLTYRALDCTLRDFDRESLLAVTKEANPGALVIDSYAIAAEDLAMLDSLDVPVAVIDDFARLDRYDCSAVLNFTVEAKQLPYRGSARRWLLGPEYLLVHRALRTARLTAASAKGALRRVLLCIGGSDRHGLTVKAARLLKESGYEGALHVVVGASYCAMDELKCLLGTGDLVDVQLPNLADALSKADLCICGGGLTKYEAAYLGVPVAVLSQNEDQAAETVQFAAHGLAVDLGLGVGASDDVLTQRLADVLRDEVGRRRLREAGLRAFPNDPTANAATALATLL